MIKLEIRNDDIFGGKIIKIDDLDLSKSCKSIRLDMEAGEPTKVYIELVVDEVFVDEEIDQSNIIQNRSEILDL